jgi:hypothetical protein
MCPKRYPLKGGFKPLFVLCQGVFHRPYYYLSVLRLTLEEAGGGGGQALGGGESREGGKIHLLFQRISTG